MVRYQRTCTALLAAMTGMLAACSSSNNNSPANDPPQAGANTLALTSDNRLLSFNSATPGSASALNITGLQNNDVLLGMDLRPATGQIIAVGNRGTIYSLDTTTGMATLLSTLTADPADDSAPYQRLDGTRFSIDTNNLADRLRIVSNSGQNLRIDMDTGRTFTDTNLTTGGSLALNIGQVAYTNNFAATCRTTPFYIDTSTGQLLTSANANGGVLTPVGSLQVNATGMGGFDISTSATGMNAGTAVLTVGGVTGTYSINLETGAATLIGALSGLNPNESVIGLAGAALSVPPSQPVGELIALTDSNTLVSFNSNFPSKACSTTTVSGLQSGETLLGIDMRPRDSALYALASTGRLYTVNQASGVATLKSTLRAASSDTSAPFQGLVGTDYTIDVSPVADGLRVIGADGTNLRVLMDSGDTITDTNLNPPGSSISAIAYTNSFDGTATSTLYVIDTANNRLMTQGRAPGSPNDGNLAAVGILNLGSDLQSLAALDINARTNAAFAAFSLANSTSSALYRIDLATGAATLVGPLPTSNRVRGLTHLQVPQAVALGVTQDARLVRFNPASPDTLLSNLPISGLQGGETILGFDIRPSNGLLYLLTDAQRVYILEPTTGVARLLSTLTPNIGDPFTRLVGTSFGIDFSPLADAMRVISDAEQNLAVVVDPGTTITATPLTRAVAESNSPSPDVVAIAYTNNYADPASSILYNIDIATRSLVDQIPANGGVLRTVGPLGGTQTFAFAGGFDIIGGEDGLSVAALTPTTSTQSQLYRINLRTGAATAVGPIGPIGTSRLIGLALNLQ